MVDGFSVDKLLLEDVNVFNAFIHGPVLEWFSASRIDVGNSDMPSRMADSTGEYFLEYTGKIAGNMPADLDTGIEAADSWYAVIVEWDSSDTSDKKVTYTLTPAAPTLTGDRDVWRKIGWVKNNASKSFLEFRAEGVSNDRSYYWMEEEDTLYLVQNGDPAAWTTVDASTLVSPDSQRIMIHAAEITGNNNFIFRPSGGGQANGNLKVRSSQAYNGIYQTANQGFQYKRVGAPGGGLDISVQGYKEIV